ncbi:hypothetical protein D0U04_15770 [Bacillus clarus]|uniref:Putative membrane protein n=1 Tax=Bacillus clarus TaxID=2338372 RepID=A0A090YUT2_9BACI|nr:hypothetical protein [Bacillus clarus]KFN02594.1 putative membrane protein [Bacillus clarus]RFT66013.1 hypothetical protein D0U04_15770 [Bacillus clarus]
MAYVTIAVNFLCSVLILIAGIIYLKNTLLFHKISNMKDITTENILKEFKLNIFWCFIISCFSILMPIWITDKNFDFLTDVLVSGFIIAGGIEAIHYLLKNKISDEALQVKYYKYMIIAILGILNGISI